MSYFAPYVDATGLHTPTFSDIQNQLVSEATRIFGSDIYLDNDSQDMQFIGALTDSIFDTLQLAQMVYNNQSPQNAVGIGLDNIVKLNGLTREAATYSTVTLSIKGEAGTVINGGVAEDKNKYLWDIPDGSTIPDGEILEVLATCETPGSIEAAAGEIAMFANPQYGLYNVYNAKPATPGKDVETDAHLQYRQSLSVAMPSQTPIEGTLSAIQTVTDVDRVIIYENATDLTDDYGIPSHSIAAVVEGGEDAEVALQIALHKTIGCGTYGDIGILLESQDLTEPISFSRPEYIPVNVLITVEPLSNYTQVVQDDIVSNVKEYLNSLSIGQDVHASSVFSPALQAMPSLSSPQFNISAIRIFTGDATPTDTIPMTWNQCSKAGNVTISGGY